MDISGSSSITSTPTDASLRLNIFYLILEKLNGFAEGKFDVTVPASQIGTDYEMHRNDALERIEALNITKRLISTCTL